MKQSKACVRYDNPDIRRVQDSLQAIEKETQIVGG
jgi:hypothetical protein